MNINKTILSTAVVSVLGTASLKAILVSGGQIGSDMDALFGVSIFEIWNIHLLSTNTLHSGFNVDVIPATCCGDFAQYTSTIPVPPAVWLFGSGLLGLVAAARRRQGI